MTSDTLAQRRVVASESADPARRVAGEIVGRLFGPPAARPFAVRFWDGSTDQPERTPRFTLALQRPSSLRRLLGPPTQRRLAEAYLRNDIDIEGDLEAAAALGETIARRVRHPRDVLGVLLRIPLLRDGHGAGRRRTLHRAYSERGLRHSRARDAAAVRYHYDVGNEFYQLWLDRRMVYSCAYFPNGREDLDAAQEAKLDLICRKLRLRRDERFLDIGCGWGALVRYAAARYGVQATGVTVSPRQAALARERIAAAGLTNRCRVELCDYRDLPDTQYDKIASVGMVEHVGRAMLRTYFRRAFRLLAPGGLFLNHGIVSLDAPPSPLRRWVSQRVRRWGSFIDAYVFPDGELVTPAETLAPATTAGFEVRDVENLREHYVRTLRHWVQRLETRHAEAEALVGEATYRVWRAFMAGSAHAFASGRIAVIQALLAKGDAAGCVDLPATRGDLYAPEPQSARARTRHMRE